MTTVADVIQAMHGIAPPQLALDGDPIGLHAGSPEAAVKGITVSLDASLPAIAEAAKNGSDMLVVHHPRFYRGLKTLAENDPSGRRGSAIVRAGLAVFSAHTNLDLAAGGTNDLLAEAAGLADYALVKPERRERLLKLAVFVPASHVETLARALGAAGAGAIGKYSDCTFRSRGIGTFRCGDGTTPFIGTPGSYEEVDEYRLETVFGEFGRDAVVAAMLGAHPYEEVAYDLYPLRNKGTEYGLGRVGDLPRAETLGAFAARVAKATGSYMAQYSGNAAAKVRRVAVWAGGGVDVAALSSCGADVVVAGEAGYHDVETFADNGVAVVTLGHGHSENLVLKPLAKRLAALLPGVRIVVAKKGGVAMRNVH